MALEPNVGPVDRYVRVALGALLLVVGILGTAGQLTLAVGPVPQALAAPVVVVAGAVLAVTGLARTCLVYEALGGDTRGA